MAKKAKFGPKTAKTTKVAWIRKEPSKSAYIIGCLPACEKIEILDKAGENWFVVDDGYINAGCVLFETGEVSPIINRKKKETKADEPAEGEA